MIPLHDSRACTSNLADPKQHITARGFLCFLMSQVWRVNDRYCRLKLGLCGAEFVCIRACLKWRRANPAAHSDCRDCQFPSICCVRADSNAMDTRTTEAMHFPDNVMSTVDNILFEP